MRLTRQSEIAIGILVTCARSPEDHVLTSVAAAEVAATKGHAAKIVNLLVHAGFLRATRGRYGGLSLARPANAIAIGAVLRHTQTDLAEACRTARRNDLAQRPLTTIVAAAQSMLIALMDRFTIADLVTERPVGHLTCIDCRLLYPQREAPSPAAHRPCHQRLDVHAQYPDR